VLINRVTDLPFNPAQRGIWYIYTRNNAGDPYLRVYSGTSAQQGTLIYFDDDSGGNANARIEAQLSEGANYTIRATQYATPILPDVGEPISSYELVVEPAPTPTPEPTPFIPADFRYTENAAPAGTGTSLDFNQHKIWAFLAAYYCWPDDRGEVRPWTYDSSTQALLEQLFNLQYDFAHRFDLMVVPPETPGGESTWGYRLSYTVCQRMTLDQAIDQLLQTRPNSADRLAYYQLLIEQPPPGSAGRPINGGHQTLRSPFAESFFDIQRAGMILHYNGHDVHAWNTVPCPGLPGGVHRGLDMAASLNKSIFAVADGVIQSVTATGFTLGADDLPRHDTGTGTYSANIRYENVRLNTGLGNGSNVSRGDSIGTITINNFCGPISGNAHYLHFEVTAAGRNIDPLLLIDP
jgi:murein DD-endopeptidase MepM/ murein hydrolase activator NlpD